MKSSEVTTAPIHASRHGTGASGRILKIVANNNVTTPSERRKPPMGNRGAVVGNHRPVALPTTTTPALKLSEMSRRRPADKTRPNDSKRRLTIPTTTLQGRGFTFQILLSTLCSSRKVPEAAINRVPTPQRLAARKWTDLLAPSTTASIIR